MTKARMALAELAEKGADADFLREMIQYVAQRLMEMDVETLCGAIARNAALLAQNRYASGLIDFQTVLPTQRTQLSTQDSVASLQAELSADHVRLVKALGGGWQ